MENSRSEIDYDPDSCFTEEQMKLINKYYVTTMLKEISDEIREGKKDEMLTEPDDDGYYDGEALHFSGINKAKEQDIAIIGKYIKRLA